MLSLQVLEKENSLLWKLVDAMRDERRIGQNGMGSEEDVEGEMEANGQKGHEGQGDGDGQGEVEEDGEAEGEVEGQGEGEGEREGANGGGSSSIC